jgi:hypothetical protein
MLVEPIRSVRQFLGWHIHIDPPGRDRRARMLVSVADRAPDPEAAAIRTDAGVTPHEQEPERPAIACRAVGSLSGLECQGRRGPPLTQRGLGRIPPLHDLSVATAQGSFRNTGPGESQSRQTPR